jgi:hypothetical protein
MKFSEVFERNRKRLNEEHTFRNQQIWKQELSGKLSKGDFQHAKQSVEDLPHSLYLNDISSDWSKTNFTHFEKVHKI